MAFRRAGASLMLRLTAQQGRVGSCLGEVSAHPALGAAETVSAWVPDGVRQASQLAVKQRMRSVENIRKITMAMKMVAASRMRKAQINTMESRGITYPFVKLLGDLPAADVEKNITVPVTSDRGLCGGINSVVARYTRATQNVFADEGKVNEIIVVGEKGRAQLQKDFRKAIRATVADLGKVSVTFSQAALVAESLLKTEYDAVRIIFNRFKSAISYKPTVATVLSPDALEKEVEAGGSLDAYEIEGPDRAEFLQDLAEFQLATVLYNCVLENNCSELASRMAAMESSTKNAKEMLGKLTLSYNRTRQAAITTELTEIISGAAALEG